MLKHWTVVWCTWFTKNANFHLYHSIIITTATNKTSCTIATNINEQIKNIDVRKYPSV